MGEVPEVTHEGAIDLLGVNVRVYRLSDGSTVFNADDTHELLDRMMSDVGELPADLNAEIQTLLDEAFVEVRRPPD